MQDCFKLINLSTYGGVLCAETLAFRCEKKCDSILFSSSPPTQIQFNFTDGTSIIFDGPHITAYSGSKQCYIDSKIENMHNTSLPTHLELEGEYELWEVERLKSRLAKLEINK